MGKTLRSIFLFVFVVFVIAGSVRHSFGQSVGDVAFIGFNSDSPGDGFAVVLFTGYSAGDEIHFSEEIWNGTTFESSGGDLTWVAPTGGTAPGEVLVFSDVEGVPSVNIGTITDDANMNLSGSGSVIYAYTGTDKDTPKTPFLGAIASDQLIFDNASQADGTLNGTGLTQGSTAILLPDNIDNAQYVGDRSGNTPTGYRALLNDIGTEASTDDNWDIYNGGDVAPFPPFNDKNFVIVQPPIIHFLNAEQTAGEGDGSVTITVELAEADGTNVNVDVVFLNSNSSASATDISNYTTQTISFSNSDADGTQKTVSVTLNNDTNFEGDEIAVFQLQNNTAGSIIDADVLNLILTDNDAPAVVINEFLADPPSGSTGDVNNDGIRDSAEDEFIEIVNNTSSGIDISGWQLSDDGGTSTTYKFPAGTVIPANQAIVVFGGGEPTGGFGSAIVQTGDLSYTNSGGFATLLDDNDRIIQNIPYGDEGGADAGDNQSITRDPNNSDNFVKHSTVSSDLFSPGTKVDGTTFDPNTTYASAFRGNEGWRMISSPTQSTTFSDLFSELWMQGPTGSDHPSKQGTLFAWDEANATFARVTAMNDVLTPAKGYIVYAFADDEFSTPGLQGGFPKIINTNNTENNSPVSVPVTATDSNTDGNINMNGNEGWNMLGNPFGTDISVDAVINALEQVNSDINQFVYIWDHNANSGNGEYVELEVGDGASIAPFQAFWIRYTTTTNSNASFDRNNLAANQGTIFYNRKGVQEKSFKIFLGDGEKFDKYSVRFTQNGTLGEDLYDAYKLFSLDANSINLFSTVGEEVKLAVNTLPPLNTLEREIRIPLGYQLPHPGEYNFRWDQIDQLPQDLSIHLIDHKTEAKIDLREREEFSFSYLVETDSKQAAFQQKPLLNVTKETENKPRFELVLAFGKANEPESQMKKSVTLAPNYPNPFKDQTTIQFKLKEAGPVTLTVWNIVGQKVATIYDNQTLQATEHTPTWNPTNNLPSGIYILKLEAAGKVLIRKMTLIK